MKKKGALPMEWLMGGAAIAITVLIVISVLPDTKKALQSGYNCNDGVCAQKNDCFKDSKFEPSNTYCIDNNEKDEKNPWLCCKTLNEDANVEDIIG